MPETLRSLLPGTFGAMRIELESRGPLERTTPSVRSRWKSLVQPDAHIKAQAAKAAPHPPRQPALAAVKVVHTISWFSIESCMMYVLWAGLRRRSDRRAAIAAGVVATESLVFAANGFRCPLTELAQRVGAEQGSVTDIYLPRWLAHNLPAIHVPLIALAGYLHGRNLRQR
jgi:hypothetical protein